MMKINKKSIVSSPFVLTLFSIGFIYFIYYSTYLYGIVDEKTLNFVVNIHDHKIYYSKLIGFSTENELNYEMNNDFGIAFIFYVLFIKTHMNDYFNILEYSLLINGMTFVAFSHYCFKICSKYNLGYVPRLVIVFNLNIIYFLQLINKDMLTLMLIAAFFYSCINKNYLSMIIILPISFLVRQQLALCLLTFYFLMLVEKTRFWMVVTYFLSSVAAGFINAKMNIISMESMGDGLSSIVMKFNEAYYIGYLLFNPIRLLQFLYSLPQSVITVFLSEEFDFAALFRSFSIIYFPLILIFLYKTFRYNKFYINSICKPIILMVYSFFICWLMNPTINARYLMLILPFILLGYFLILKVDKLQKSVELK